jgi:predicted lipoprotein with Yx(FWY)xxD motif
MKKYGAVTVAALVALVLLAGCGSSSSSSSNNAASTTPPTTSTPDTTSTPGTTPASSSQAEQIKATKGKLGTYLVDGEGKTVYLFEKDKPNVSNCSGACAGAWPPVTTSGTPSAASGATMSMLGTIKRADGTMQVTYNGHPLYYFVKDTKAGDTHGQGVKGFGADWYVVTPKGGKIDES